MFTYCRSSNHNVILKREITFSILGWEKKAFYDHFLNLYSTLFFIKSLWPEDIEVIYGF